ncbi:MAG: inositol monophosphatase [Bdellovibrionales bacterium]
MLNVKIDLDSVAKSIREVADSCIVPRFQNLHTGEIHFKGEDDPVTIADQEAEKELSKRFMDLLPGSKVVGEESFAENPSVFDHFLGDSPVWIIDPVDGTKCFIAGEPLYGVIVSLTKQNHTLAAWLYDPTSKEFITAEEGSGAYWKGQKLSVLPPAPLGEMTGILGLQIMEGFEAQGCVLSPDSKPPIERMYSACHDYSRLVAPKPHFSGRFDQVHFHGWSRTCTPWDCAAGVLIHKEAGGYSAHWNGDAFVPSSYKRGILAAPDKESWESVKAWIESACECGD